VEAVVALWYLYDWVSGWLQLEERTRRMAIADRIGVVRILGRRGYHYKAPSSQISGEGVFFWGCSPHYLIGLKNLSHCEKALQRQELKISGENISS
jgi:hypothetical protein